MQGATRLLLWMALVAAVLASEARAQLIAPPAIDPAFTAVEAAVIDRAICLWENELDPSPALPTPIFLNFFKVPLAGGFLGLATNFSDGISPPFPAPQGGLPVSADINLNANVFLPNPGPNFFVDPSPGLDEEYKPDPFTHSYMGAFLPQAIGSYDLLSTAIHEISHALGFTITYNMYLFNVMLAPTRPVYAFAGPPQIGHPLNDYNAMPIGIFANGGAYLITAGAEFEQFTGPAGETSHLDDALGPATNAGYFPLDTMNQNLSLSERRHIADVDIDILADAFGYTLDDLDGDGIPNRADSCPTLADVGDLDSDNVDDACDTCIGLPNPVVTNLQDWMTTTSGQRDDDGDGIGNACDFKYGTTGTLIAPLDVSHMRSSVFNQVPQNICGLSALANCAQFDHDEAGLLVSPLDVSRLRNRVFTTNGPACIACAPPYSGVHACDYVLGQPVCRPRSDGGPNCCTGPC